MIPCSPDPGTRVTKTKPKEYLRASPLILIQTSRILFVFLGILPALNTLVRLVYFHWLFFVPVSNFNTLEMYRENNGSAVQNTLGS